MSLDGFDRVEKRLAGKRFPLSHNLVQMELMKFVFLEEEKQKEEQKRIMNPTKSQIFDRWLEKHAKGWGHVVETHESDEVDTSDPAWLEHCYELLRRDENETLH